MYAQKQYRTHHKDGPENAHNEERDQPSQPTPNELTPEDQQVESTDPTEQPAE
jgi:hypothetical protein